MLTASIITSTLLAALVGGVFFAFSVFVMRALDERPAAQGIAAMQRINLAVITPLFLGAFLGTAPLLGAAALIARAAGCSDAFSLLGFSFVVYAVGSVVVTMLFNVPRNGRLAALDPDSPEAAAYWPAYVREWLLWNHVRCIASVAAAALAAFALAASGVKCSAIRPGPI